MSFRLLVNILLSEEDCQTLRKEPIRNTCASFVIKSQAVGDRLLLCGEINPSLTYREDLQRSTACVDLGEKVATSAQVLKTRVCHRCKRERNWTTWGNTGRRRIPRRVSYFQEISNPTPDLLEGGNCWNNLHMFSQHLRSAPNWLATDSTVGCDYQ